MVYDNGRSECDTAGHDESHLHSASEFMHSDIEATDTSAEAREKAHNTNVVDWDGPDDPSHPRNWSVFNKALNIGLVSFMAFLTPLTSSMFAPAVPEVMIEFMNFNIELASFVVSVFVLGFAFGPLVLAPLSEVYGRLPLYWICNVLFLAFVVACAESTDMSMMTGFRFLSGFFGGMPLAVGAGTITDLMDQSSRGIAISIFSAGPLLGPVVGPIAGGFLAQAKGWRWVFWVVTILSATCTVAVILLMSETYAPIILARKTRQLRKSTGNMALRSKYELEAPTISTTLLHSLVRPMKLLCLSPIVLGLSLFMAFCFGCLFLLFTTFTMVYQEVYGWDMGLTGLSFLGLGIGCCVGMVIFGLSSDRILARKARKSNGEMKPEYRLVLLIPTAFLVPIGLFWYGWAAEKHAHWVLPILGTFWIGVGFLTTLVCISSYLMDAFTEYSASAMAAASLMRSVLGGCLPVAGRQMYRSMGYGRGTSLLAFLSLALAPLPFIFYRYGESLRKRFTVNLN